VVGCYVTVYMTWGRFPRPREENSQWLRTSSRSVSSMPSLSILMPTVFTWRGCIDSRADGYVNSSTITESSGSKTILKILYSASVFPHDSRTS